MSNEFEFSTAIQEIPVVIDGSSYILKEATESQAAKWRNEVTNCSRFSKGQLSGIKGLGDTQSLLVSMCLYNGDGKSVPLDMVRSWPSRIVRPLFDKIQEISELREAEEDEGKAKKDSNDMEAGS